MWFAVSLRWLCVAKINKRLQWCSLFYCFLCHIDLRGMNIFAYSCFRYILFSYLCGQKRDIVMDYLPTDPAILVSSINMLLRDEEFDTLESLCFAFGREPQEVCEQLRAEGFVYSEEQRQFRPAGFDE